MGHLDKNERKTVEQSPNLKMWPPRIVVEIATQATGVYAFDKPDTCWMVAAWRIIGNCATAVQHHGSTTKPNILWSLLGLGADQRHTCCPQGSDVEHRGTIPVLMTHSLNTQRQYEDHTCLLVRLQTFDLGNHCATIAILIHQLHIINLTSDKRIEVEYCS